MRALLLEVIYIVQDCAHMQILMIHHLSRHVLLHVLHSCKHSMYGIATSDTEMLTVKIHICTYMYDTNCSVCIRMLAHSVTICKSHVCIRILLAIIADSRC